MPAARCTVGGDVEFDDGGGEASRRDGEQATGCGGVDDEAL